ncbi:MAG TPA: thioesterase family protein [Solirubrobacteraceae bacterium]|jgi:acyl-CoA thioester hydrolase|nr:thioesterase family protein [Solirubrobacteraceae bacterium]
MAFVHPLRVRYNECDAQGHVFNANYAVYFDIAVTELWREALGSYGALLDHGLDLVVAEMALRFRAPARFDDELSLELVITRLGTTSTTARIDVRRGETLVVEGEIRHVFVREGTTEKAQIPDQIRTVLQRYAS